MIIPIVPTMQVSNATHIESTRKYNAHISLMVTLSKQLSTIHIHVDKIKINPSTTAMKTESSDKKTAKLKKERKIMEAKFPKKSIRTCYFFYLIMRIFLFSSSSSSLSFLLSFELSCISISSIETILLFETNSELALI